MPPPAPRMRAAGCPVRERRLFSRLFDPAGLTWLVRSRAADLNFGQQMFDFLEQEAVAGRPVSRLAILHNNDTRWRRFGGGNEDCRHPGRLQGRGRCRLRRGKHHGSRIPGGDDPRRAPRHILRLQIH